MRTWTLVFLLVSGVVAALLTLDGEVLALLARGAFALAVLVALLAGMRQVALQMAAIESQLPMAHRARARGHHRSMPDLAPRRAAGQRR
jgi:hypothetical protein